MSNHSKGQEIMEGLLLSQYQESPNLKQYIMSYISEFDELFTTVEEVYLGRFLETAVGKQLDTIGDILQQSRSVVLPRLYFGFQGALNVDKIGDATTPTIGGEFLNADQSGYTVTPLEDEEYRRMLMCKGSILNAESLDVETCYKSISILLGRVPSKFILRTLGNQKMELELETDEMTERENQTILYMLRYITPAAVTFTILLT